MPELVSSTVLFRLKWTNKIAWTKNETFTNYLLFLQVFTCNHHLLSWIFPVLWAVLRVQRWAPGKPTSSVSGSDYADIHRDQLDAVPTPRPCLQNSCSRGSLSEIVVDSGCLQPFIKFYTWSWWCSWKNKVTDSATWCTAIDSI